MLIKHQPGKHDQQKHGHGDGIDGETQQYMFSAEERPVPRAQHQALVDKVLASLGAHDVKVELIYDDKDPNYKALFKEMTDEGKPLPKFVPGKGPLLDFGGGEMGIAYAIYDDTRKVVSTFEDAFSISERDAAGCLGHEVSHAMMDRAKTRNPDYYKGLEDFSKSPGKELAKSDGITNYSRSYWEELAKKKDQGNRSDPDLVDINEATAIDETVAELAKLHVTDRAAFNRALPVWKNLYDRVKREGKA